MKVVNNSKASARTCIINDLKSNLTAVGHEKEELGGTASVVLNITQGSYLRADEEMSAFCTKASEELERALSLLKEALTSARELDTTEEKPD